MLLKWLVDLFHPRTLDEASSPAVEIENIPKGSHRESRTSEVGRDPSAGFAGRGVPRCWGDRPALCPQFSTPTGLCPPAQGCEALRATLGSEDHPGSTPKVLRPFPIDCDDSPYGRNPVGVDNFFLPIPQGCSKTREPWAVRRNTFGVQEKLWAKSRVSRRQYWNAPIFN